MSAHGTRGSGMTWVGRAIRRLEDPALITGQGRFTADLPAVHWVRFVRSPVAAGNLTNISAPKGAMVIISADLKGVKKITPMLHKFNYKPIGQPALADGTVRFAGEPVAAVVAASEEEAEDIADQVDLSIEDTRFGNRCTCRARTRCTAGTRRDSRQCHPRRESTDPELRRRLEQRTQNHQGRGALPPPERELHGTAERPCVL